MTVFATAFSVSDRILDGFFGEAFSISARAEKPSDPNARRVASQSQPDVTFAGIWDDPHTKVFAHNDEGHRDSATRRLSPGKHTVDYQVAAIPFAVQRGFVVTRMADGSRYEVADVVPDGLTRATMALTATTRAKS